MLELQSDLEAILRDIFWEAKIESKLKSIKRLKRNLNFINGSIIKITGLRSRLRFIPKMLGF